MTANHRGGVPGLTARELDKLTSPYRARLAWIGSQDVPRRLEIIAEAGHALGPECGL
jgi:hypothetical protein